MLSKLLEMNGHEFKEKKFNKAVLAVGSTEYHGEHLPYGTDTMVAEHLAEQLVQRSENLLMLPTLPIGMSHHYSNFPVALSITTETLMRLLKEIFESLNKHNLKHLLIINGHDGNIPAIQGAVNEYRTHNPEFKIAVLEAWWETAGKLLPESTFQVWNGLGHAGEGETSIMLYIKPELVNMGQAIGVLPDLPEHVQYKWVFNEITPYGTTGDPTKATKLKGSQMSDALVDLLVTFIKEMDKKNWEL